MNYLKSVASGFFKSCRFHEPSDNFSVKSDDADRTTDGVGKGKATWGTTMIAWTNLPSAPEEP